jgi:hypothetical protein
LGIAWTEMHGVASRWRACRRRSQCTRPPRGARRVKIPFNPFGVGSNLHTYPGLSPGAINIEPLRGVMQVNLTPAGAQKAVDKRQLTIDGA